MNTVHRRALALALVWATATACLGGACSLGLTFDDECELDADCASRGPGLVCRSSLCVASGGGVADVIAGQQDGADTGTVLQPATRPEELLNAHCTQLLGVPLDDALEEDTILLGALFPLSGQLSLLGPYLRDATEMAIDELNGFGGLRGRKFAVLVCDSGTDPAQAASVARHLAAVAQVPAILGPFSSSAVIEVYNEVAYAEQVVLVSAGANAPVMSSFSGEGLVWSTSLPSTRLAHAIGEHLKTLDLDRIAVVNRADPWGSGMREEVQRRLCGENACAEDRYYAATYDPVNLESSISTALAGIRQFSPDVVVLISYIEDGIHFLQAASEAGLTDFIAPDGLRDAVAIEHVTANQEALCKLLGTSAANPSELLYESFRINFTTLYGEQVVPYTANAYDAAYLLAYGIAAAEGAAETDGEAPLTGPAIAAGLQRLSTGVRVEAGPSRWPAGYQALLSAPTATINFVGVSGDVDFGDLGGNVSGDVEAWHFNLEAGGPESLGTIYTADGQYQAPDFGLATSDDVCEGVLER